uniref:Uncharacterized protein n=1 Tax=Anguilla anguilla TaxID=7936 RepID=A0A0E9PH46_ANGAN
MAFICVLWEVILVCPVFCLGHPTL